MGNENHNTLQRPAFHNLCVPHGPGAAWHWCLIRGTRYALGSSKNSWRIPSCGRPLCNIATIQHYNIKVWMSQKKQ
jgi:hypothetical protein